MGRPFWVDDPSFNLDYHVRHTALPKPGSGRPAAPARRAHLLQRLDRSKPLWELWLAQGLDGGRFALISKTHHALVDGVSGVDIATGLFDLQPTPAETEGHDRWSPAPRPSDADLVAEGIKGLVRTPTSRDAHSARRGAPAAPRAVARGGRGCQRVVWAGLNPAPDVPLNVEIGPHRRIWWVQSRLADFKEVKNALGGTVNDAVLAVVAGALGRWLARAVCGPGMELRALVPVSIIAQDEHGTLGNRIAAMRGPLPVYATTRSSGSRSCARDGPPQGVQAGTRGRGDRRPTDFAPPTLLAQASRLNFSSPLQPDRDQRAGPAVPALPARPRDGGDRPDRLPPETTPLRSRS